MIKSLITISVALSVVCIAEPRQQSEPSPNHAPSETVKNREEASTKNPKLENSYTPCALPGEGWKKDGRHIFSAYIKKTESGSFSPGGVGDECALLVADNSEVKGRLNARETMDLTSKLTLLPGEMIGKKGKFIVVPIAVKKGEPSKEPPEFLRAPCDIQQSEPQLFVTGLNGREKMLKQDIKRSGIAPESSEPEASTKELLK